MDDIDAEWHAAAAPLTTSPRPLTRRQRLMLDWIRRYIATNTLSPTLREIRHAFNLSSTSVVSHNLGVLEDRGFIRRKPHAARGISLPTEPDWRRQRDEAIKAFATIAQLVHHAYHRNDTIPPDGTWRTCPIASCVRARDAIAALGGTIA